jgi:hypothetical protein
MCCAQGSGASAHCCRDEPMVGNQVRRDGLSSDARLGNDRDDPARRVAELNFPDRMDQPRDERSLYHHGCLLTAMLVIAAASRDFWIRRLESLHINQAAARETVPGRQRLHRRIRLPSAKTIPRTVLRSTIRSVAAEDKGVCFPVYAAQHVRFGSKADLNSHLGRVRSPPGNGH